MTQDNGRSAEPGDRNETQLIKAHVKAMLQKLVSRHLPEADQSPVAGSDRPTRSRK